MKRWIGPIGIFVALVVATAACDWPMLQGSPDHAGSSPLEHAIGTGNVASVHEAWSAGLGPAAILLRGSPAISHGLAYAGAGPGVEVFDASGSTNCSGTPVTCPPLWTAATDTTVTSPAVVGDVLYALSLNGTLYAFDAHGSTNCSGVPKTCAPLWKASTDAILSEGPTVGNNGVVYVEGVSALYAFDGSGITNCSGAPKTCQPLWVSHATGGTSSPAFSAGVVYTTSGNGATSTLSAFDAAGTTGCSGIPKTCQPLWTSSVTTTSVSSPSVVNGKVYLGANDGRLDAFDATGTTHCSGTPKVCTPVWSTVVGTGSVISSPAVANGVVYAGTTAGISGGNANTFGAFDANTGVELWSAQTAAAYSPTIANGVVYVGTEASFTIGAVLAFDAAGMLGCSGVPKHCTPLWGAPTAGVISAIVPAEGRLFVSDLNATLHVFQPTA